MLKNFKPNNDQETQKINKKICLMLVSSHFFVVNSNNLPIPKIKTTMPQTKKTAKTAVKKSKKEESNYFKIKYDEDFYTKLNKDFNPEKNTIQIYIGFFQNTEAATEMFDLNLSRFNLSKIQIQLENAVIFGINSSKEKQRATVAETLQYDFNLVSLNELHIDMECPLYAVGIPTKISKQGWISLGYTKNTIYFDDFDEEYNAILSYTGYLNVFSSAILHVANKLYNTTVYYHWEQIPIYQISSCIDLEQIIKEFCSGFPPYEIIHAKNSSGPFHEEIYKNSLFIKFSECIPNFVEKRNNTLYNLIPIQVTKYVPSLIQKDIKSTSLNISNLPADITELELYYILQQLDLGSIYAVSVSNQIRVAFLHPSDTVKAKTILETKMLENEFIKLMVNFQTNSAVYQLNLFNLSPSVTKEEIKMHFPSAISCDICTETENIPIKFPYCILVFETSFEYKIAELTSNNIFSKNLKVIPTTGSVLKKVTKKIILNQNKINQMSNYLLIQGNNHNLIELYNELEIAFPYVRYDLFQFTEDDNLIIQPHLLQDIQVLYEHFQFNLLLNPQVM